MMGKASATVKGAFSEYESHSFLTTHKYSGSVVSA